MFNNETSENFLSILHIVHDDTITPQRCYAIIPGASQAHPTMPRIISGDKLGQIALAVSPPWGYVATFTINPYLIPTISNYRSISTQQFLQTTTSVFQLYKCYKWSLFLQDFHVFKNFLAYEI